MHHVHACRELPPSPDRCRCRHTSIWSHSRTHIRSFPPARLCNADTNHFSLARSVLLTFVFFVTQSTFSCARSQNQRIWTVEPPAAWRAASCLRGLFAVSFLLLSRIAPQLQNCVGWVEPVLGGLCVSLFLRLPSLLFSLFLGSNQLRETPDSWPHIF